MPAINYFFLIWALIATGFLLLILFRPKIKNHFLPGQIRTKRQQEADAKRLKVFVKTEEKTIWHQQHPNPYQILGISPDATKAEVERAFKRRIMQYHPDLYSRLGEEYIRIAKERTIQITKARETLLKKFKAA